MSKLDTRDEVVTAQEKVTAILSSAVWASLPWNAEGQPDTEQIEEWKDLERREEAEEWLSDNENMV